LQSVSLNGSVLIVNKLTQERLEPSQERQSPPYAASYLSALVVEVGVCCYWYW
jgi:hypothetical protein